MHLGGAAQLREGEGLRRGEDQKNKACGLLFNSELVSKETLEPGVLSVARCRTCLWMLPAGGTASQTT